MTHSADKMLLGLPGTAEEREWLGEHLEVLSVKERTALAAAVAREPPQDMAGAVNCLLSLEWYEVRDRVGSYEALGEFFLYEQYTCKEHLPYFDLPALGQLYEEQHPGLFIGNCYVEYPKDQHTLRYDGTELPEIESEGWSVRLKLASEAAPEGVWIRLPDYDEGFGGDPGEIVLALDELGVKLIQECALLDARCALPCVQNLAGQYEKIEDLVYDGQELGFLLDGQEEPDFAGWFAAALEFEHCRRLEDAVRIGRGLDSYDLVSVDAFIDQVKQELNKEDWAVYGDAVKNCFNYAAYAAALAEQQGYQVTDDEYYFIRKRDSPELEQQPPSMTMQ